MYNARMSSSVSSTDSQRLKVCTGLLEGCLARDVPGFEKRLHKIKRRVDQGQPVDREMPRLERTIEQSCQRVADKQACLPQPEYPDHLPIYEKRDEILKVIKNHQVIVLCGETGSGKTTQLPKLCIESGRGTRGRIGHTQPRRIAARSLASRIAQELHTEVGQQVGFKVRFQDQVHESSCIKIMTDGILLAEIQSDPELREYDTLIIDEAHERSLNIDFILGYLHQLLPRRPDLKLIITSATIDTERFSKHFDDAPIIEVSGRTFPVEMRYRPLNGSDEDQDDRDRGQAILEAVDELAAEGPGDVLVFLPGERAIRDASEQLRKHHPDNTEIFPLYARMSIAQQSQLFKSHHKRRIVLATNVAETSLTVPGIRYVVDTGLARISRYSYRTKVQRLPIERISQASANQRAGRCGRVAAGVCIRLYAEDDFESRPEFTMPEIQRTNLAAVILQMSSLGLGDIEDFPFVDAPDGRYVRDGYKLLHELGAVAGEQDVTPLGKQLARLPLDPRIARMTIAAGAYDCVRELLVIASALSVMDPRDRPAEKAQVADQKHALFRHEKSDFLWYLNAWKVWQEQKKHLSQNKLRKWCSEHFLSYTRMREWQEVHQLLSSISSDLHLKPNKNDADYRSIHCALLTGLLGNLAVNTEEQEYLGARNLKFVIFPGSTFKKKRPKWLVAAELVETQRKYLRTVAMIDPEWVEEPAKHLLKYHYSSPHWEKRNGRVDALESASLYGLPLISGRKVNYGPIDPQASRILFINHALVRGEFRTQAEFALRNQKLMDELDLLESKSRRRDVLVDEETLFEFFDETIPTDVYDSPSFERWWKTAVPDHEEHLSLTRDQVMHHDADSVTEERYPGMVTINGLQLAAHYHFSPGHPTDGLCVQIPLVALNQLRTADFDWLVPGFLEEKLVLLIKSLPKQLRRNFVPAPSYAQACIQTMPIGKGDLIESFAEHLHRMTGVMIPADSWRLEQLPNHLFASFELIGSNNKLLATGKDLQKLQQEFGGSANDGFIQLSDPRYCKSELQDWDFGELPEFVEVENSGLSLRAYPALEVSNGQIELKLFDRQEEAASAHQRGLLALFRNKSGRLMKEVKRVSPEFQKQAMWFATIGAAQRLHEDLEVAVLQAVFLVGETIRDEDSFQLRLAEGKAEFVTQATHIGKCSYDCLQAYHDLNRILKKAVTPQLIAAISEIRSQMEALIYGGFLSATPIGWLKHVPRYLCAAKQRLEKLSANPSRDRSNAMLVSAFQARIKQLEERKPQDAPVQELRWHLEELRVSLFAQELGTSIKISPERLERLLKSI